MSTSLRGGGYGVRVGATVLGLLVLSGGLLLVLFAPQAGDGGRLFGDPFARSPAGHTAPPASEPLAVAADSGRSGDRPVNAAAVLDSLAEATPPVEAAQPELLLPDPLARARHYAARSEWSAALRLYDRLRAQRPGDVGLAMERANVLTWAGDHAGAATALREVVQLAPADRAAWVQLARVLWWSGQAIAADAAVSAALRMTPEDTTARALRSRIRQSAEPSVPVAQEWLASNPAPLEHLLLGRAHVREGRAAEAVPHYRMAFSSGLFGDSLALETASVATAADSLGLAAEALKGFLRHDPADHAVRLRLARVLGWSGRSADARREYRTLMRAAPDRTVAFELAQLDAWSGQTAAAQAALLEIVEAEPHHVPGLKLLGDLARWRGDWDAALAFYASAAEIEPAYDGLAEGVREVERMRLAGSPAPAAAGTGWSVGMDGFGDSERFRWLSTRAARSWGDGRGSWGLAVYQDLWDGASPLGLSTAGAGYGAEVLARANLSRAWSVAAAAGARSFGGGVDQPTWSFGVSSSDLAGAALSLDYLRQPALRRVASTAALEAEAVSDLLQLTFSRPLGGWHAWSRLEVERLNSALGTTGRGAGSLALSHGLGGGWSGFASFSALTADGASPVLAGWGPLYWAPASYLASSAGLAYRTDAGNGWRLGGRLAPGHAWIRERDGPAQRYASDRAAILGAGFEAAYVRDRWQLESATEWSGTLGPGYRAAALRLQAAYFPSIR